MTSRIEPYRVSAYNTSKHSENKMHDDTVAKRYGFNGGLVPGVDVMAYMMHLPVAKWGRAFLERGLIEARFIKPVYDGEPPMSPARKAMACFRSRSRAAASFAPPAAHRCRRPRHRFRLSDFVEVAAVAERKPVNTSSYASANGSAPCRAPGPADAAKEYLADIRETEAIYAREGLGHPGLLPRVMNKVLVDNAIMGPWIHVGTRMQLLSAAGIGDELTARAKVTGNYDKKGHRFVELDALVVANGTTPLAHCQHIAIYQPREQAAA